MSLAQVPGIESGKLRVKGMNGEGGGASVPMVDDVPRHGIAPDEGVQGGHAVLVGDVFRPGGQEAVGGNRKGCVPLALALKLCHDGSYGGVHHPCTEDDGKEEDGIIRLAGNIGHVIRQDNAGKVLCGHIIIPDTEAGQHVICVVSPALKGCIVL